MCGIFCVFRSRPARPGDGLISPAAYARLLPRLERRGPDWTGRYDSADGRSLMVHTRLAIQDLTPAGAQPMFDVPEGERGQKDPGVTVCFNGEIYNAPALRRDLEQLGVRFRSRTDTEVIVHGYARWGFAGEGGLLDRLRGMFAIVILDQRTPDDPVVHAAVDHVAMKPLVYSLERESDGAAVCRVATDMDVLRAGQGTGDVGLDLVSLAEVLTIGYVSPRRTMWADGKRLGPGEMFTWRAQESGEIRPRSWWKPPTEISGGTTQERFEEVFEEVVAEHMLSDRPVGLFLSAGLDSSAVALALARRGLTGSVEAVTLATRNADLATDESPDAARLAKRLGMDHRIIPFDSRNLEESLISSAAAYDAPQGFSALLTAARIAEATVAVDDAPRVVLAGDGGDEAFGGYSWHRRASHPVALQEGGTPEEYAGRYLRRIYPGLALEQALALLPGLTPAMLIDGDFGTRLAEEDAPALPHPRRAQRMDVRAFLPGSILPKIDQSAMHVALELRAPFLDRRVLEFGLSAPVEQGEETGTGAKPFIRRYLSKGVAEGLVSEGLLNRPKQGFSLRTPESRPFTRLAPTWVAGKRIVERGVLSRGWEASLSRDAETHEVQSFALCFLAAWYETRC